MFFKNKNWNKKIRIYECTNIVACEADHAPNNHYIPVVDLTEFPRIQKLWIQDGVQYYGYL